MMTSASPASGKAHGVDFQRVHVSDHLASVFCSAMPKMSRSRSLPLPLDHLLHAPDPAGGEGVQEGLVRPVYRLEIELQLLPAVAGPGLQALRQPEREAAVELAQGRVQGFNALLQTARRPEHRVLKDRLLHGPLPEIPLPRQEIFAYRGQGSSASSRSSSGSSQSAGPRTPPPRSAGTAPPCR